MMGIFFPIDRPLMNLNRFFFVFFYGQRRLKDDEEIVITRDKYEGATLDQPALLLKKAKRYDAGAYSCRLGNDVGIGRSHNDAFLAVQCNSKSLTSALMEPSIQIQHFLVTDKPDVRLTMLPTLPVNELEHPNVTLTCDVMDGSPSLLLGVRW